MAWANKAELLIQILKESVQRDMNESNSPIPFWDYCVERRAQISNLTANRRFNLQNSSVYTLLTQEKDEISNLCKFNWYEWYYYRECSNNYPFTCLVLGRVLGPATGEGNKMCQWVLKANGNVVPCRTVRSLKIYEVHKPVEEKKEKCFMP